MPKWIIDSDHSVASFSIKHMMIANVRGQFNKMKGEIRIHEEDITKSSIEMTIDVNSIITGIQKRDDHLRSADFFDATKYPYMTFKSKRIIQTGINGVKVIGDLEIHGITKESSLDVEHFGPVKSPFGETTLGLTARTEINREDFGILWNEPMDMGGFMVGKDVQIIVDIEADLESDKN